MKINEHVLKLKESATLAINLEAKRLKDSGKVIYHWGFGQSPFPVPAAIQEALKARTAHKEYLPTLGLESLRERISSFMKSNYKLEYSKDQIFIGPGSKELLFQMLYLLETEVIIPAPSWVSYGPQVNLKGDQWHTIKTSLDNNYKLTATELDNFLKTKEGHFTLILNSPNNPTGQIYSNQELKSLAEVCKQYDVLVLSDEIYGQVNFTTPFTSSIASYYYEKTIITGGLSKAYSAGGYRLGYMLIPKELSAVIAPLKSMISETFSAVAAPIQYAAIEAYNDNPEVQAEVQLCSKIHHAVAAYFHKRLTQMGIQVPCAEGAFYMFISFNPFKDGLLKLGIKSDKNLCDFLLDQYGIALLPGEDFYYDGYCARLAFVDYNGVEVLNSAKSADIDEGFVLANIPQVKAGLDQLEKFIQSLTSLK